MSNLDVAEERTGENLSVGTSITAEHKEIIQILGVSLVSQINLWLKITMISVL